MDNKNDVNKKLLIGSGVISIIYFIANILISGYHEAWRDEGQAWTIAKNLSLPQIYDLMSTEGHFIPWFFILKCWYRLGGSFSSISVLSAAIMTIAVFIFMYKAPFHPVVKLLIISSSLFIYYNAVISRCYCIIFLTIIFTAAVRKYRAEKPIPYCIALALILQTHVLLFPLAIALLVEHVIECIIAKDKRRIIPLLIPVLSLVAAFDELHQSEAKPTAIRVTPKSLLDNMKAELMLPNFKTIIEKVYDTGTVYYVITTLLVVLLAAFLIEGIRTHNKRSLLLIPVVLIGVCGYLAIVTLVRDCYHIHLALVFYYIILFSIWISKDESDKEKRTKRNYIVSTVILTVICVISYKYAIQDIRSDVTGRFSNSLAIAQDIRDNLPEGSIVIVHSQPVIASAYSYASEFRPDITFWNIDRNEEFTCLVWGDDLPYGDINELSAFPENTYFLTNNLGDDYVFELIAEEAEDNTWVECYRLYRAK